MRKFIPTVSIAVSLFVPSGADAQASADRHELLQSAIEYRLDSIFHHSSLAYLPPVVRHLTDDDYCQVADEIGIDVPSMKAIVEIEAGKSHIGISPSGLPVVNFDTTLFRRRIAKAGINPAKAAREHPEAFAALDIIRYGSIYDAQYARYLAACEIDPQIAAECTFWGMFQIGGFNWNKCGTVSIEQFVDLMSRSERDQLELFSRFLQCGKMIDNIRNHRWSAFARQYNGPGYQSRGYHTRLASAYKKYSRQ